MHTPKTLYFFRYTHSLTRKALATLLGTPRKRARNVFARAQRTAPASLAGAARAAHTHTHMFQVYGHTHTMVRTHARVHLLQINRFSAALQKNYSAWMMMAEVNRARAHRRSYRCLCGVPQCVYMLCACVRERVHTIEKCTITSSELNASLVHAEGKSGAFYT